MADPKTTPENKISFKETLNLPTTDFPIRAQAAIDDPKMLERWAQEDLYGKAFIHNKGKKKFVLHDGPPYANGHIHIGHAYNKILKDIVGKSQRMFGKQVPITPGWDCHGLPIELKVTQENPHLKGKPAELKKACREYAQKWIDTQKEEFKKLGVVMDWARPYTTMSYGYEAAILRAFGMFVEHGYIERKNKTVPWCPSDQTVLASAEIEYQDRKDPSLYVLFPLEQSAVNRLFANVANQEVSLVIWTTTPWTLALNRAVLAKPGAEYVVLDINGKLIITARALADKICALLAAEKKIVAECTAEQLVAGGTRARHPFINGLTVPLILSDTVSLDDGTAFVHCAPGCGPEDYEVGIKNNLEIFSPISPEGTYMAGIQPAELEGMAVADGQIWAIKKLAETGTLLFKTSIKHSYPHCWRCRNALIFRATKQWFCNLEKNDLKERALAAADTIQAVPDKSVNRLKATIEGRLEWVLSRQRIWGVPIPALICSDCDYTHITKELIDSVSAHVAKQGVEYWDNVPVQELLPAGFACPSCKSVGTFTKEFDILDVWFDSGVSHYAVLKENPELAFPAQMYLEGKDQHRGWFQSSLLTAMVIEDRAPMDTIVTHGFTVDAQGRKMSKSLGNVVSPQEMIEKLGTDGLRLWVSSIDCSGEAIISPLLMENIKESFRKIRNTCRFLLSNLYDYDHEKDALPLSELQAIDRYALHELYEMNKKVLSAYDAYDFTAVFHTLSDYCAAHLSSLYLDVIKDRLYVEKAHGPLRRSAQTSCWYILDTMTKLMAPILSFTAEQVSDHYQKNKNESIHLQNFAPLADVWQLLAHETVPWHRGSSADSQVVDIKALLQIKEIESVHKNEKQWEHLLQVRGAVLKALEGLREQGIIKHSLEAQVTLHFDPAHHEFALLKEFTGAFYKEFFIVSQVHLEQTNAGLEQSELPGLFIKVAKAEGEKCPRCWNWDVTQNEYHLCRRCQAILAK